MNAKSSFKDKSEGEREREREGVLQTRETVAQESTTAAAHLLGGLSFGAHANITTHLVSQTNRMEEVEKFSETSSTSPKQGSHTHEDVASHSKKTEKAIIKPLSQTKRTLETLLEEEYNALLVSSFEFVTYSLLLLELMKNEYSFFSLLIQKEQQISISEVTIKYDTDLKNVRFS
jgi:phosphodiesterase/alkaline phosphatase D-like protein